MLFSCELLWKLLLPLAEHRSYKKTDTVEWSKLRGINYRVGVIKVAIVFGVFDLPCGRYPGQREAVMMNVIPEYLY